jgi:hypothetical protein
VQAEPDDTSMQYQLGMVYGKLRDKSGAETHLKEAVSLASDSPAAEDAKAALEGLG